uniref:Protein UBASH3A-like protein n=1 Tax=Romanomermis culicivorax TaxID=13658 RepID=A0A915K475_ROMCU
MTDAEMAGAETSLSDFTTFRCSEIAPPAPSASQYNVGVSAAASAYAKSVRNFDNYSCVGPVKKDADKSFAKAVQQMQAASRLGPAGGGSVMAKKTGKRAFIMRHGERMDRLFPEWLTMAITDQGTYMPYDMNMPLVMIDRSSMGGWNAYEYDSPVTEMGNLSGQMIGRGLKSCGIDIKSLYCSPSLRCVQTASGVLKTLENMDVRINVEPGLFEWLAWYDSMPKWLDASVLVQAKHRVNEQYQPVMTVSELAGKKAESTKEYYERISNVVKKIVEKQTGAGSILIVGHGSTMDAGVRSLIGKPASEINRGEMDQMGMHYPYCSIVAAEEGQGQKWAVQPAVLPQLTFLGFSNRFNPDYLNRP